MTQAGAFGGLLNTGDLNVSSLSRPSSANSINSNSSSNHSGYVPELPLPSMGGDLTSRLSSDEGEVDGAEESEKLDCHFSGRHPRPLGVCVSRWHALLLLLSD